MLSDSHDGVVAQVEYANNRLTYSLESRAKTVDALLHEWKSDLLRIWIPLIAGAAMLIGLFGGIEIQACRDSGPAASRPTTPSAVQSVPDTELRANGVPNGSPKTQHIARKKATNDAGHER